MALDKTGVRSRREAVRRRVGRDGDGRKPINEDADVVRTAHGKGRVLQTKGRLEAAIATNAIERKIRVGRRDRKEDTANNLCDLRIREDVPNAVACKDEELI